MNKRNKILIFAGIGIILIAGLLITENVEAKIKIIMNPNAPFYMQPEYNPFVKANLIFFNNLNDFGAFNNQTLVIGRGLIPVK